jgi:tRNA (guanine26-N2/guanine27-N2)-dimethyltransferase
LYEEHHEGAITFLRPPLQKVPTTGMMVFFNPRSELNRDATVVALQTFISQFKRTSIRVCTPLAGTGVRPVRIAKEVTGIEKVIVGDANPQAVELIKKNRDLNHVEDVLEVYHKEANQLLAQFVSFHEKFDVIDIDPFGSPREFFDSAIRALKPPALLCLTATDMPVLVGIRRRTCIKRYAAVPLKTEYSHELAVRILLGCIAREAASHNIGIFPLLSFSVDHYIRLYALGKEGDENTWNAVSHLGFVIHCEQCGHRSITNGLIPHIILCEQCKSENTQLVGPLWIGKLGDKAFIEGMCHSIEAFTLGKKRRVLSLLNTIKEEVDGPPTYYDLHHLSDKLNIPVPSFRDVIKGLCNKGAFCVRTHFSPHAIRTSASIQTLTRLLLSLTRGDQEHEAMEEE